MCASATRATPSSPASARGRGMLEVEIEDLVGGTVSSVFREVDVVEGAP